MSKIVRSKQFRDYCQKVFVWAAKTTHAMSEQQAMNKFNETLYDDFNTLTWIMDTIFPHSRWNGNVFEFITDDIDHTHIGSKITENIGRCVMTIDERAQMKFVFENPKLEHGHLLKNGYPECWGGYVRFDQNVCKIGFSGALMDMYNFTRHSAYYTVFPVAGKQGRVEHGHAVGG